MDIAQFLLRTLHCETYFSKTGFSQYFCLFMDFRLLYQIVRTVKFIYIRFRSKLFLPFGFGIFCFGHYIKQSVMSVTELLFTPIKIEQLTWGKRIFLLFFLWTPGD